MDGQSRYLLETLLLLVVMSALAVLVLWVARRAGVGSPRGPIRLVGQLPLEPRRSVYLIRIAERVLVIGVAEGTMVKLAELDGDEVPAMPEPTGRSFAAILAGRRPEAKGAATPPSQEEDPDGR